MRYQIPQFIEIEDKIFGPLTIKQFIYLAGAAGLSYLIYSVASPFLPFWIVVVLMVPIAALGVALAFYKVNEKPFLNVIESAVKYYIGSKLYIWKKEDKKVVIAEDSATKGPMIVPRLADSKLKDLAWNLNISQANNNQ